MRWSRPAGSPRRPRCGSGCRPRRRCRRWWTGRSGWSRRSRAAPTLRTAATSSTAGPSRPSTRTSYVATPPTWPRTASDRWRSPRCSRRSTPSSSSAPPRCSREELGPDVPVSLSHEIGRVACWSGRTPRSSTRRCASSPPRSSTASRSRSRATGIAAPLYLSQNDGTLMDVEFSRRYPVATFASGPTNSMRGAAVLVGPRRRAPWWTSAAPPPTSACSPAASRGRRRWR